MVACQTNGGMSNKELKAWIEVCNQIFGGWDVQTMWNLHKNVKCMKKHILVKKIVYKWANYRFSTINLSGKDSPQTENTLIL